jgi:hypothetical protein
MSNRSTDSRDMGGKSHAGVPRWSSADAHDERPGERGPRLLCELIGVQGESGMAIKSAGARVETVGSCSGGGGSFGFNVCRICRHVR